MLNVVVQNFNSSLPIVSAFLHPSLLQETWIIIAYTSQVLVRNVPPDPDESVSELVEHFFLVNHPHHYLIHQVCFCSSRIYSWNIFGRKLWILLMISRNSLHQSCCANYWKPFVRYVYCGQGIMWVNCVLMTLEKLYIIMGHLLVCILIIAFPSVHMQASFHM